MRVTVSDWIVFLYNVGAVLSGAYAVVLFEISDRFVLLGVAIVFAFFWTVYFKFYMRSRLETVAERRDPS